MMQSRQLPFDLGHREASAREDFWVSDCNRDAVACIDRFPWEAPLLVIYGPAGCGKTHLCRVLEQKAGGKVAVIDDADAKTGDKKSAEEFFHLYNKSKEEGRYVLMTGKQAPKEWSFALPDLKSRVLAAPSVAVGAPDDQLTAVLLTKLFSDRQIFVPQDVVQFILSRAERSFEALRSLVAEIDRCALAKKRPVTIPLVRELMQKE